MTIEQIVKIFLEHGAAAALAVFAILQLRLSYQERAAELKEAAARKEEENRRLEALQRETLQALQANARALATLAERLGRGLPKTPSSSLRKRLPE